MADAGLRFANGGDAELALEDRASKISYRTWDRVLMARPSTESIRMVTMNPVTADGPMRRFKAKIKAAGFGSTRSRRLLRGFPRWRLAFKRSMTRCTRTSRPARPVLRYQNLAQELWRLERVSQQSRAGCLRESRQERLKCDTAPLFRIIPSAGNWPLC